MNDKLIYKTILLDDYVLSLIGFYLKESYVCNISELHIRKDLITLVFLKDEIIAFYVLKDFNQINLSS
ncbi:hypothetical protein [Alkaliphilus sp. B6464]|uniref:hypothetical protein n=1 Tax=Alkaliphilus sp. B6464 TaxID=2731219 RepID=UPI001BADF897|nr:hypothetical protein [Alkaliphilus sp. B6464]QUH22195.1 hypothetical protein HYG84_20015 [Alkaliphilus sp. B6464]